MRTSHRLYGGVVVDGCWKSRCIDFVKKRVLLLCSRHAPLFFSDFIFCWSTPSVATVMRGTPTGLALCLMNSSKALHFHFYAFQFYSFSHPWCHGPTLVTIISLWPCSDGRSLAWGPCLQSCIPQSIVTAAPLIFPKVRNNHVISLFKTWGSPLPLRMISVSLT